MIYYPSSATAALIAMHKFGREPVNIENIESENIVTGAPEMCWHISFIPML